jgi:hypothetical protein
MRTFKLSTFAQAKITHAADRGEEYTVALEGGIQQALRGVLIAYLDVGVREV